MRGHSASLDAIEDFLSHKRIAMVGVSRDPANFSIALFKELCARGYDVIPVNPHTDNILGHHCYRQMQDIKPPVDAALLMTSSAITDSAVADCVAAGVRHVWMYRATGKGAVSESAVAFCLEQGIKVIPGECPFMFFRNAAGVHRFHSFLRKITGRYPRRRSA